MSKVVVKGSPGDDKLHVAVLAFPFGTHAGPLLSLVKRIAAEHPKVTFSFFSTAKSNDTLFSNKDVDILPSIKPYNVNDGLPDGYVPSRNPVEPVWLFIKAMPDNYKLAIGEVVAKTGKKITCFVTDAFYWFGADLAQEMKCKWVPLWTAGPHSLLTHVYTDLIRERVLGSNNNAASSRVQNVDFLPGFPELKASDLPEGVLDDIEVPFAMMLHKMGQELPRADVVCINSFTTVHPLIEKDLQTKFKRLLHVGPFVLTTPQPTIPDEHGCLDWLDMHDKASVIYISFGSLVTPPPHELVALAEALEECGFPFIWAMRGDQHGKLPNGFLERTKTKGKVVSWAPQMEILKHPSVGVCLTHSGWNSVLDCIVGGVPMISRPFFGDQRLNSRMLESVWQIGVGVDNGVLTKQTSLKAFNLIVSSEKGNIMRHKIVGLQRSAMEAVDKDGSSTVNFNSLIQFITS